MYKNEPIFKVIFLLLLVYLSPASLHSQTLNSPKPLLGWNSWDSYGTFPTEKAMLANMGAMEKKLKPFGYTYFVIDFGWQMGLDSTTKTRKLTMDNYARYIPSKSAFPNGIKAIADAAHAKGLKFGIHIMRGIPREAYKANLPILNTNYTARDIGDTTSKCTWSSDNYGVNMSKPGAQEYYDSYISQLISWGVDFIKADDITGHPAEVLAVKEAIRKTGKSVVLSLSPGGDSKIENVKEYNEGNMLRVTKDIWDNPRGFGQAFAAWKKWVNVNDRKFWLDMDMIPFGHLCLQNPDPNYLTADNKKEGEKNVKGRERMSSFTEDQKYTFITIRALSASPLFMGGDLPTSDDFSFKLLTNKELLACNQNGVVGKLVYEKNGIEIWKTPNKENPEQGWLGIFNRNENRDAPITVTVADLDINSQKVSLVDVWKGKGTIQMTGKLPLKTSVAANGVTFYKYTL